MIFEKKIFFDIFDKFENLMAFEENSLTIPHETAKNDEKNRTFSQKAL